jgi:predicted nucleic acid-binding protein
MLAVDTNVVVRYLVGDHPEQSEKARALVPGAEIWISSTVLLETAWVLGKVYGYKAHQIAWALRLLAGLPTVSLQSPEQMNRALGWLEILDAADAIHLAQAVEAEAFVTFDQRLLSAAAGLDSVPTREP